MKRTFAGFLRIGLIAGLIFGFSGSFVDAASAQDESNTETGSDFNPILVTVHGKPALASDTPGSVSVIDSEDIQNEQPISIPDAMNFVPGVKKNSDSPWGSDINIRGLSRDSVVFVLDGARINTASDINGRFGLIDPAQIERIEVLKGPISSLYGSGTIGGVVNVITKSGKFVETPSWDSTLSSSGATNPGGFSLYGSTAYNSSSFYVFADQTFRNYSSFEDGSGTKMRNSQFEDYNTSFKLGVKENDENKTEAQFQFAKGRDIGIPGSGTAPLPSFADVTYTSIERDLWQLVHTWTPTGMLLKESQINLYYQTIDREVRIDNFPAVSPVFEIDPEAEHKTLGSKWQNRIEASDHTLTTGLDVWQRDLDSSRTRHLRNGVNLTETPLPNSSFFSGGAFLEDDWKLLSDLNISAGARYDKILVSNDATNIYPEDDVHDHSWNAHLGSTLELSDHWNTKAIVARGYRAASLEERFTFLDLGGGKVKLGDPNLKPEESVFSEWSLQWLGDSFSASGAVFYNHLKNLIANKVVNENLIVNANIDKGNIWGTEFEMKWLISDDLKAYGNIAWARGTNPDTDEYLPSIPPLNGAGGIRYGGTTGYWMLAELPFSARQNQTPEGVSGTSGWVTTNLRLGYDFKCMNMAHRLYAGVENLFDQNYREYLTNSRGFDYNEPGRSFMAGYQIKF